MNEAAAIDCLAALAQPSRLEAFRHLLGAYPGGVPAGRLARALDVPHNTMSSHLGVLSRAGLIEAERDGRTIAYRADAAAFRRLVSFLASGCCGGRPDLCGDFLRALPAPANDAKGTAMQPAFNVLFLCTRNSARSIVAEVLLRKIGGDRFNAYSAGSQPARQPMPEIVDRLRQLGHDVSKLRCKSWNEFTGPDAPRMDFVIALCDTPQGQACPDLGEKFVTAAWPLPDPAAFKGSPAERAVLLDELCGMVRRRLEIFTSLPFASLDRMALKKRLDEIGGTPNAA